MLSLSVVYTYNSIITYNSQLRAVCSVQCVILKQSKWRLKYIFRYYCSDIHLRCLLLADMGISMASADI